jgi:hypothetical protein
MLLRTYTPVAKSIARYTALGSPAEHCGICRFYAAPNICARVVGPVVPAGWCKFFSQEAVFRPLAPYASGIPPGVALDLSFMTPGTLDPRISFTRASTATYFDSTGTLQTAAANAPRWDYNPVTHALAGLLIEVARTNVLTSSGTINGVGNWTLISTTEGATVAAPDGTNNGATLIGSTSGSRIIQQAGPTVGTNTFACSVWLKSASPVTARLGLGSVGIREIVTQPVSVTTTWQRFAITATGQATDTGVAQFSIYCSDGTSGNTINAWGAQLEQGAFATSYIPTTAAPVTRAADLASMPTAAWFNATNGTYQAEFIPNGVAAGLPIIIGGNAGSPTIATGADSRLTAGIRSGAAVFSGVGPLYTFGAVNKAAFAYLSGASNAAVNGTAFGPNATALTVTGTAVELGSDGVTPGANALDGWLRRVRYWPRVLTNAELQSVTT